MQLFSKLVLGSLVCFFTFFTHANPLENLRHDLTVPNHCQSTDISDFDQVDLMVFTVGPTGAHERGFNYEYPLLRHHATWLYKAVKSGKDRPYWEKKIRSVPGLWEDYKVLLENHIQRGFDFKVEGEILELLSIIRMQEKLDGMGSGYFVSGSIVYHGNRIQRVIGELDMIVGDKMTCKIVGYGEVKLGLGSIGKAREQVHRFFNFLQSWGYHPHWQDPESSWFEDDRRRQDQYPFPADSVAQAAGL